MSNFVTKDMPETPGERMRFLRILHRMDQRTLAQKLGVSQGTYLRYEADEAKNMNMDFVESLAKELKTSPAYLMGWAPDGLDHLPLHLREFVCDPENKEEIEKLYLNTRKKQIAMMSAEQNSKNNKTEKKRIWTLEKVKPE